MSLNTEQITARLEKSVAEALKRYCRSKGLIINRFIEDSIIDKLHEVSDLEEIPALRKEATKPFSEVLAELDLDG